MSSVSSLFDPQAGSFLMNLPFEISREIFFYLDPRALVEYSATCKKANAVVHAHLKGCFSSVNEKLSPFQRSITTFLITAEIWQWFFCGGKLPTGPLELLEITPLSQINHVITQVCNEAPFYPYNVVALYEESAEDFQRLRSACPLLFFSITPPRTLENNCQLLDRLVRDYSSISPSLPQELDRRSASHLCVLQTRPPCALLDVAQVQKKLSDNKLEPAGNERPLIMMYNAILMHLFITSAFEWDKKLSQPTEVNKN